MRSEDRLVSAALVIGLSLALALAGRVSGSTAPAPATGGGACCLDTGCLDTASETECTAMGGFFLPGETCAEGACGVGACCAGEACLETEAYTCRLGGRFFAGAGTTCDESPCDLENGACCLDGACEAVPEAECAAAGGTWLGLGTTCANDPCRAGACCLEGKCFDGARYECDEAGGAFVAGGTCEKGACLDPKACPSGSLFSQPRDPPDDFTAGTSEFTAGIRRWEDFAQVAGAIESITWWGLDLDHIGGNQFEECVETDPTFEISFHRDAGGVPGAAVCFYKASATRTPLGIFYRGAELNEYEVVLVEPCTLVNGWISIVGLGDPECWFLWMSAGPGRSWCEGCGAEEQGLDLSLCLLGTEGGVFGACCDDATGVCLDGVEITDCTGAGLRFEPDATCDSLDPPCGVVLGACCFADATCTRLTAEACAAAGGDWLGANTLCDRCPCLTPCPKGARAEGEPRCAEGYIDDFNGGCFSQTPVFSSATLGETICGESGVYPLHGKDVPDVDVYEVTVPRRQILEWTATAEFQPLLQIIDGNAGCDGFLWSSGAGLECEEVSIAAVVPAGTYWLLIRPFAFTDTAACGARYTATIGPDLCPADLDGSGAVDFGDILAVLSAWGPCPPEEGCPEDLDESGAVDFGDVLLILGAWGDCP